MKDNSEKKISNVGLIVHSQGYWAYDSVLACPDLNWHSVDLDHISLPFDLNPYALSTLEKFDAIFVASHTWRYLIKNDEIFEENLIGELRKRTQKMVLLDGWDSFNISVSPHTIKLFDIILKTNGVYKDKDLYNWKVGCDYSGINWKDKIRKKKEHYSASDLEKIHVSFPCILGTLPEIRKRLRPYNSKISNSQRILRQFGDEVINKIFPKVSSLYPFEKQTTHFLGDLAHWQRLDLIRLLYDNNIKGEYGVFRILNQICGKDDWMSVNLLPKEVGELQEELKTKKLILEKKNRFNYLLSFAKYKSIISPVGFGEMCFRHIEVMLMGGCTIMQDLSHVDHLAPFREWENIVPCKPDLSDLLSILKQIEEGSIDHKSIGKQALLDAKNWAKNVDFILYDSIIKPLDGKN